MKNMQVIVSAFLGGVLTALAGMANLLLHDTQPIAAALLFGVMLLAVTMLNLHLLTAKAGYLLWDSGMIRTRAVHPLFTFCGNVIGAAATGELLRFAYTSRGFAKELVNGRFSSSVGSAAVGAVLCGVLMFVGVHAYRRSRGGIGGTLVTLGAGAAIVLCNFTHSITDIFYMSFRHVYNGRAAAVLLIGIIGNVIGALLTALLYEYKKSSDEVYREQEEAEEASERRHAHHHHHTHSNSEEE